MENKDIRNWSGFQNENGPDWHYDTAHKWCFFSTREDCEKHECEWRSGGNPLSLGKIPVCADKSAPNDRSKDSKNRKADCKDPIPDCNKWTQIEYERYCKTTGKSASSQCVSENSTAKINGCFPTKDYDTLANWVTCQSATTPWSCRNRCEWNNSWVWWKTYCSYLTKETCENAQKSTYYGCKWENNTKKEIICREKWSGKEVPAKNCNWLLQPSCESEKPISVYLHGKCSDSVFNCTLYARLGDTYISSMTEKIIPVQMQLSLPGIVEPASDNYYLDLSDLFPKLKRGDSVYIDDLVCDEARFWNNISTSAVISTDLNVTKQAIDLGLLGCVPVRLWGWGSSSLGSFPCDAFSRESCTHNWCQREWAKRYTHTHQWRRIKSLLCNLDEHNICSCSAVEH